MEDGIFLWIIYGIGLAVGAGAALNCLKWLDCVRDKPTVPASKHLVSYYSNDESARIGVDHAESELDISVEDHKSNLSRPQFKFVIEPNKNSCNQTYDLLKTNNKSADKKIGEIDPYTKLQSNMRDKNTQTTDMIPIHSCEPLFKE